MTVLRFIKAALAAAWVAVAGDLVVESTLDEAETIRWFGRAIADPGRTEAIATVAGVALTVGAALVLLLSAGRRAERDRRARRELEERSQELSLRAAQMNARDELLRWRLPQLQSSVDTLQERRGELLEELGRLQAKLETLRTEAAELAHGRAERAPEPLVTLPDEGEPVLELEGTAAAQPEEEAASLGDTWSA
jgi:hypothetical protein